MIFGQVSFWLMPLLLGAALAPVVLWVAYFLVLPRAMTFGYRSSQPDSKFDAVQGGAGSIDIEYYTLFFDVRSQDVLIRGPAPQAVHWQFAAFDGFTRVIQGAYTNNKTTVLDGENRFLIRLTSNPLDSASESETLLDCSANPRGLAIFRIVLPEGDTVLPDVKIVRPAGT